MGQGNVLPGKDVLFLPTHTASTACPGKIFTVEMHHKRLEEGGKAGDNIGMNVKALNKDNMPRVGDVMIYKEDDTLKTSWRLGKDTGGEKADGGVELKTNDQAEVVFVPQQPMVVDKFSNCEGLARIAFLDGNSAVMLGKVQDTNLPVDWATGKK